MTLHGSRPRRLLLALTVGALALGTASAVDAPTAVATATATGRSATSAATRATTTKAVRWTTTRSLCATPADPRAVRCYAQVSVDVPRGTAGATAVPAAVRGHGAVHGYSPGDLAKAYGYNPRGAVKNQTVALVDWFDDPYALADLNVFNRHYGLPQETSTSFRKVNQHGRTSPMPRASRALAGEISLDVEAVRAVCLHCRILLVEADNGTDTDLAAAENTAVRLGATEISNSWGGAEFSEGRTLVNSFHHPGVVITASTGDDGWYGWDPAYTSGADGDNAASYPSTSPYVVSVGGTRLEVNADGTRRSEVVWNGNRGADSDPGNGATGGGCSQRYTAPSWQAREAGYKLTDCKGKRLAADVSVLADPAYGLDVFNRFDDTTYNPRCKTASPGIACWQHTGGTSLSSPVVAALYALAGGSGGSAYPAASLYVNSHHTPAARYDVTLGGNGYCGGDSPSVCSQAALEDSADRTNNPNGLVTDQDGNVYGDLFDCSYRSDGVDQVPARKNAECTAGTGLDGPTGLGTPNGLRLFADTSPNATFTLPGGVTHGRARTYSAALHVTTGARVSTVTWSWGDGTSTAGSASTSTRAVHTYRRAGRYTLTFTVHDSLGQIIYRTRTVTVR